MTVEQWPLYFNEVYRVCKPGIGWVQAVEFSGTLACDDGSVPKDAAVYEVVCIV